MKTVRQGTNEKRLHLLDFGDRLDAEDYITAVTWTVEAGITTSSSDFSDTTAEIVATGGTVNTEYSFQAVVDTSLGRKHEKSLLVLVVDR